MSNKIVHLYLLRYLGLTPKSSDLKQVLVSLCIQICAIYNMDSPPECDHDSINRMTFHFKNTLELVSKHHASKKPLLLVLDGLDKLTKDHRSESLFWLPRSIPNNVYLLVSVDSTSLALLEKLHKKINSDNHFLELCDLIEDDLSEVIDTILKANYRLLNDEQKTMMYLKSSDHSNALYVRTLCVEAAKWKSYETTSKQSLPESTSEAITIVMNKLEDIHGAKFVQKTMCYLCLLKEGITETELCDLVCSDQEVLQNIYNSNAFSRSESPNAIFDLIGRKIRSLLKCIDGFTKQAYTYGRHLIQWNSDLYFQTCSQKYFGDSNPFTGKNDNIDDTIRKVNNLFTAEKPLTLKIKGQDESSLQQVEFKCPTMPYHLNASSSRKLKVLPQLITHSGSEVDFSKQLKDTCLCYYPYLLNKVQAFHPDEVKMDFKHITERDVEVETLVTILELAKPGIKPDPKTLALQLLGCLPYLDDDYPLLNQMLIDAQNWVDGVSDSLLLVPMFPSFPNPQEMCKARLWNIVEVLTIDKSGRLGVVKNENGYVEIWDLECNEVASNLGVRVDKVQPNVFTNETKVLGLNGTELSLWEIECGTVIHSLDIESIMPNKFTTFYVFCHSNDFNMVTLHGSDEDFNQILVLIDMATQKILSLIEKFDVKDEFFKRSSLFNADGSIMAFLMARSEVIAENKSADFLKFKIYSTVSKEVEYSIECGQDKKFNKILLQENRNAIISWKDCSFDVFDVNKGELKFSLSPPDSRLAIENCGLTEDNYLIALTSSLSHVSRKYYALWFWNIDEQTPVNLISQRYQKVDEVPKLFVIIEELHIAILGCTESTNISVWDLPNSECMYTGPSHTGM